MLWSGDVRAVWSSSDLRQGSKETAEKGGRDYIVTGEHCGVNRPLDIDGVTQRGGN